MKLSSKGRQPLKSCLLQDAATTVSTKHTFAKKHLLFKSVFTQFVFTAIFLNAPIHTNAQTYSWAKGTLPTTANSTIYCKGIVSDNAGNIYVTGHFSGRFDFDPSPDSAILYTGSASAQILYLAKYDKDGHYVWAKKFGPEDNSASFGKYLAIDAAGNIYVTGTFQTTINGVIDFDPGPGTANLAGQGSFLAKYDSNGNYIWAKNNGSPGNNQEITVDQAGKIYYIREGLSSVIAKYESSDGSLIWSGVLGTPQLKSIKADNYGNIYTTGIFSGTVDFDLNPLALYLLTAPAQSTYIAKYDSSGHIIWAKSIDYAGAAGVVDPTLMLDRDGNICVTGMGFNNYFGLTVDFDPGPDVVHLNYGSYAHGAYIAKYDTSGSYIWAIPIPGMTIRGSRLEYDNCNNIYFLGHLTTGTFSNIKIDFDPGPDSAFVTYNIFSGAVLAKYNANGNYVWVAGTDDSLVLKSTVNTTTNIAFDRAKNEILVAGAFGGKTDFDPSPDTAYLNGSGLFIAKYLSGAPEEICGNGIDDDCDGLIDEDCCPPCTKAPKKPAITVSGTSLSSGTANKFCNGDVITVSVNAPDANACTYVWTPPAGGTITSGQGTTSVTIALDNNFSANSTVSVYAQNLCGQTLPASKPVNVGKNIYKPGAIAQSGATKICPNETRIFSVVSIAGISNYIWNNPAGTNILSGQGTTDLTLEFTAGFMATSPVQVFTENACGASAITKKNATYGMKPPTPSAISGDNIGVCGAANIPYSIMDAGYVYNWFFDTPEGTVSSGQGTAFITVDFTTVFTIGALNVTAANGCGISSPRKLSSIKAIPAAPTVPTGSANVCFNQANVAYSIPAVQGASAYTWTAPVQAVISDGVTTSTSNTLTTASNAVTIHFGTKKGTIKVVANNACGSSGAKTLAVNVTNCVPPRLGEGEGYIQLFPNPVSDVMNVMFCSKTEAIYTIKIYDALGKEVLQQSAKANEGSNQTELNVSNLAAGVYQMMVIAEGMRYKARFVVE